MNPLVARILMASFFWGIGGNLSWFFLNFHLEAIGFSKTQIGYANAVPAVAAVLFSIPLAFLIPRLGYIKSLLLGGGLATLGMLLVSSGFAVYPGLLVMGLGGGFVFGSISPLLAKLTDEKKQVGIFTWQQALGSGAGFLGSLLGGLLPEVVGRENVLYLVALAFALSSLFFIGFPESTGQVKPFALRNRRNWLLLMTPQILISLGAGLTIPFLNLYLQGKFNLSYASVGWLFAATSLTAMAAILIQPYLARRLGKVGAIIAVQASSLPFLLALAYVPWLPLVMVALFVRGALMTAAGPVYTALVMEHLDEEERSGFLLIEQAIWQLGWAISSSLSGHVQEAYGIAGFNYLWGAMLIFYAAAIVYYPLFFRPRRSVQRGHDGTALPRVGQSGD